MKSTGMKKWLVRASASGLLMASNSAAFGQTAMFEGFLTTPGTGMLDTIVRNNTVWEPLGRSEGKTGGVASQPSKRQPAANPALLRFTPNLAVRQRNLAGLVTAANQRNPGSGTTLQSLFDTNDVIALTGTMIAPLGLRTDNVADAMSFYLISNWMAIKGTDVSPTRAQAQAIKAQVSRALLSDGTAASGTNAQKQETAESLLVQSLLVSAAMQGAQGNAEAVATIGARAGQNVKGMGLDLAALELGPNGFEVVK